MRKRTDSDGNHRWPGGCPDCDAFQTLDEDHGVYLLTVHHDDGCPFLSGVTR